jgi:hypothetical protein
MMRRSTVEKAIRYLRETAGAYLAQEYTRWGPKFYLRPAGKEVTSALAAAIMRHPAVECRNDGLFPWAPQTWRVRS